ncbi:hypothetical protein PPYR_09302 [Photinus pyralis]|uniref:Uncharacterized protein n=1 Tax=Photinus pyralis TaxID=7054 RepID=A0A1Y1JZW2_PHOPY|nr:microtubule-associated protein futsch-like [Photinus pyralis]XP_031345719.1 microtubule-associated protein futsch-like [Photinus pyralis]KAB0798309.1 hypothetical protein PPYR_09302 [Photinus pyralis]
MSRRTPIKELIAEESSTPSSPVRRSTRIAVRRPSVTDENHEVDKLSVSSTGSQRSISTRSRAASKSPLTLANEEEQKLPAKRTRRRGSTSSLIEEELETMARSSPIPPKIGRRTSGRSMSCSPITEMENVLKSSTPQKEVRGRRRTSALIEPVTLESIKEVETKSPRTSISTEETRDEDLPFKKKKAVLLQTITENVPDEVSRHTKVNGGVHLEEKKGNAIGDSEASVVSGTEKSALAEEKKLVILLHDISSSEGKGVVTDLCEKSEDELHNTDSSGEKETVSHSTEQSTGAKVPKRKSHSGMDTTAEIGDPLEKENVEDAEKRLLNSFEDKQAEMVNTEQSIVESSFDEPMDVDVTATPSKTTVRESMDIQEFTQAEKEEEMHRKPEKDPSSSTVEKVSTLSDEAVLNTSKESTLKSLKDSSTDLPPDVPGTPKSKTMSKAIPHEKSLSSSSSKHALVDEEDLSENIVESSQKDSPKRTSLEKKLDSPSHKTKLDTPNAPSPVLVASTITPLRRSPRLLSHSGMKDSVDITSSPDKNDQEKVSEDTALPSRSSIKDSIDIASSPVENNRETVCEDIAASKDICVKNVVENRSNTDEKLNKTFNSTIDLDLDPALKEKISTLTEALEIDSSSDAESVTHYIDDMAEEGEEDTPSEGSNDIIDIGESVGSTASEIDSEESYEVDSFIDDDEEELELLSGEEYDLGQEKPKKTGKLKKRIVQIPDSSDEECKKDEEEQVIHIADSETEANKAKEDSDMENMSTRPYCGLSPPVAISIRDSPECDETLQTNRLEEEICTANLINKEDNLESLEHIKEHKKDPVTPEKSVVQKISETTNIQSDQTLNTPNNSILHENVSLTETKRRRKSSINIKENVTVAEIADGSVSDRILKVVEAFCSTVNQPHEVSSGNVSLNLSLDYIGTSPPRENDDETVGRKRVLSDSGVEFYQAKKRLSKDSGRLSNKRRSNDPFVVETQNETLRSPSKKTKINSDEQANVWDVSLPNKQRNSFTESSPKKLGIPQIRPEEERINILEDIVIPEPKRSPKKKKQSLNVETDGGTTLSPRKKVSLCEAFIVTEENQSAKETKITPKKQRNLSDSTNTVHSDIQSMQIVETKLKKKSGKKKSSTDVKNDENIASSLGTNLNHTFELSGKEDNIVSQKGRKKNKKRELISESENVFAEPSTSAENESDDIRTKKSKRTKLAESIVKEDTKITKKKKSNSKNTLELEAPSQSQKRPKSKDGKKSKPKPASDSEMSDDLDEQLHGKYSKLEKTEGLKSKSKSKKNPPVISVECIPEKVSSSEGSWKIEYLPANVKQALQILEVKKVKSTTVYRKPKLLPSSNNPQDSWDLDVLNVTAKPTTSKKLPEHHPKDFKGRSTFDSKRVRRMETKELLKSKEKRKV